MRSVQVNLEAMETEKAIADPQCVSVLNKNILKLNTEKKLHLLKAENFYNRKWIARIHCRESTHAMEAVCIDYGKNLSCPNIQTNDVYYKIQLSAYAFNVFYLYPETEGKKGSDDVCSLIHHYVYNFAKNNTKHLQIFCDSCSGQNKNCVPFLISYGAY
ncbi:hypothetical protein PYW08_006167 [Mythimna loreyi]|uniref:Uncharacterized protein n=1 Tax=Mythimna loreyi TaxID=667449 RepID=A0ACC2QLW8_9NEOP|nr:hypothetical protein PYW08_006167 [Mythimna loreyi]